HPASGEFRQVVGDEAEASAAAGGKSRGAARLAAVRDAFEPALQIAHEVGDLLGALTAVAELRMHVEAERRLRATYIAGLIELNRFIGVLQHTGRIDPEGVTESFLHRPHAAVEHAQISLRYRRGEP